MAKEYFVKEEDIDVLKDNVDNKISSPNIAEVGQILSVKAIDGNGKPTEWEVVNKPGSGPGESSPYIYMTQAEYEALTEYEQDKMYWVTYPFGGYVIWINGECNGGNTFIDRFGEVSTSALTSSIRAILRSIIGKRMVLTRVTGYLSSSSGSTHYSILTEWVTHVDTANTLNTIGSYEFAANTSGRSVLEKINLSESIDTIQPYAFRYCDRLTQITIPNSVKTIKESAFIYCSALETAVIGNGITSIDSYAFTGCDALKTITINKPQDSVSGAPWGATNATVVWTG